MGHFWQRVANLVAFVLFLSSSLFSVFDPIGAKHQTYLTPAPFAFSIWGLVHLQLFLFVIWQFFGDDQKFELIGHTWGWHFIIVAAGSAFFVQLIRTEKVIIAWILSLLVGSAISSVYYRLAVVYPNSSSGGETLFLRSPVSLLVGWWTYLNFYAFTVAFGTDASEYGDGPKTFDYVVAWVYFFVSVSAAIALTRGQWKTNGYGDPLANIAQGITILGIAVQQGAFWIEIPAYVAAALVLLACVEPWVAGLFGRRTVAVRDLESATAEERRGLVAAESN
ncbi:hypothetical protein BJ742DRAFT_821351 [Cladochytrium replicatum]|nr:hypothetical protein BJ742DRAFT_821351 [Cladochytrium replicatum]